MASCDLQANLSNTNLKKIKECLSEATSTTRSDSSSAKIFPITKVEANTEALNVIMDVNVNYNVETVGVKSGVQPTKIPGPKHVGSTFKNRKYTTVIKSLNTKNFHNESFDSTRTLVNATIDSGVQMDCSTAEDDSSTWDLPLGSLTPRQRNSTESMVSMESLLGLETAEQQTLRVLQRAVAEMEADVAMHSQKLEEEIKLEEKQTESAEKEQCQNFSLGSSTTERKLVRVEELLGAEHDIDMLQKLLQRDNQLEIKVATVPLQSFEDLSQSELIIDRENMAQEEDVQTRKHVGSLCSIIHMICGKGFRTLSYPILFCGMAVGLLFYFRKD